MATVIWAAAAAAITMDGAAGTATTTAGHAVDIAITIDVQMSGGRFRAALIRSC